MHADSRPFSHTTRAENLDRLASESFDLLVIGGGITGVAIARDAALRGIRTALVEKNDWAAGTSSRSARLIHGGLRYLEYYQFGLVFEALSERAVLRRIAPRLVRPTPFMYPLYRGQGPGFLKLAAGMWLYDILAQFRNVSRHRMMLARETARREPIVAREGLRGAARYYDAVVDDARLTLATAQSAHRAGAVVANHAQVVGLMQSQGQVVGAMVRDEITGREMEVKARIVVNACGPWVDNVRSMDVGVRHASPLLRPTKGVHLIIRRERLTSQHAIAFDSPRDDRHLYVIPWGDFAIIGTTDTDYTGDPDALSVTPDDADYLLEAARHAFLSVRLTESDVISAYIGLRALIGSDAASTYAISREHHIEQSESGLFTIAGGKLTTHRLMARETVDTVAKKLGGAGKCVTDRHHIESAERVTASSVLGYDGMFGAGVPAPVVTHLVEAYGAEAVRVLAYVEERPKLGQLIVPDLAYIHAEVHYAIQHEMALSLSDVLIRRTHVIYETPDAGGQQAREVAALMAEKLGWDRSEQERQVAEYERQVALTRSFRR
jgi:glycerol-3-phosphate dehydrogenase